MAPIYETDIARQRWDKGDWENYELWEKVASRNRRQRRLWVLLTALVFVGLSSVPVVVERWDKWATLAASRRLAEEVNHLKRDAAVDHAAYRLRFAQNGAPEYRVEKAKSCLDPAPVVVRTGRLFAGAHFSQYALMTPEMGRQVGIPGLIQEFCYDFLSGSDIVLRGDTTVGFGIAPIQDLSDGRQDRFSIVLVNGPSGEPTFD